MRWPDMTSCRWTAESHDDAPPSTPVAAPGPHPQYQRLEPIDEKLLELLIQDGRASMTWLAHSVGLSVSATAARVHRLRESGVITGFRAQVDPSALGLGLSATVRIRMAAGERHAGFEEWLAGQLEISDIYHCTGHFDYELHLSCRDPQRLRTAIAAIRQAGGALETETTLLAGHVEPRRYPEISALENPTTPPHQKAITRS